MSTELQTVLAEVPYMKEIIMTGQIAMLAFKIAKENAGAEVKASLMAAWNMTIGSMIESWLSHNSMYDATNEYLDYLSLINPALPQERQSNLDLREYWDATRTHNDRGMFHEYQNIMMRQGHVADRREYLTHR